MASEYDDKHLIEWDGKSKNVIEHSNQENTDGLFEVVTVNGSVWYLPFSSNMSFMVSGGEIKEVPELCNIYPSKDGSECTGHTVVGDIIFLHKNSKMHNSPYNIKITAPQDYYIFHALYEAMENQQILGLL